MKMKTTRKILRSIIALIIVITLIIPTTEINIKAADTITYTWDAETATLTLSGSGDMERCNPGEYPWSGYQYDAEIVIIEEGITSIEETAFYEFYYLTSVDIADSVKTIGAAAFGDCYKLEHIDLGQGVETLSDYAFQGVKASEITLPASLKEMNAPLTFFNCNSLTTINIDSANPNYLVQDNIIYNNAKTELLFYPKTKKDTEFVMPATVTTVGANAMRNNAYLTKIVFSDAITTLGDWCFFNDTALENIDIPNTVTSIGNGILEGCTALKKASVGTGVSATTYRMFSGCTALEQVALPATIKEIDLRTFYECTSLSQITLPEGLTYIGTYAFYNCDSLGQVTLPSSIQNIDAGAFEGSDNVTLKIPEGLEQLDDGSYARICTIKVAGTYDYTKAYQVLEIVNEERAKQGLAALSMDKDLMDAAMKRAAEISFLFEHTRPNGQSCFSICQKAYGENIAAGSSTASAVMTQWMNSSGHKANILTSSYTTLGVGCFEMKGIVYWVQLFGISTADKPSVTSGTKSVVETVQIKKGSATFETVNSLPSQLNVGNNIKIELRTINQGWQYVYCMVEPDSFDWYSSNESVATVGERGKVTAIAAGTCTITAKYKDTNDVAYTWTFTSVGDNEENPSKAGSSNKVVDGKVPKAKIKKIVKKSKKKVTVKIKKIKGADGYLVKCCTNKKYKKKHTTKIKTKKLKVTFNKLKKGKTYYFKVKAFVKDENGNKIFGDYSKIKKIKM